MEKKFKRARGFLIFWSLFFGISGLPSVVMLWFFADSVGMGPLLVALQSLPFGHLLFATWLLPGLALLVVITVPNLIGGVVLIKKVAHAEKFSVLLGIILMLWTTFELVVFGPNALSIIYLIFGGAQLLTALIAVSLKQKIDNAALPLFEHHNP
jgi:hypothetical protein